MRFVQVWSGADNGFPRRNWDSHEDLARDHRVILYDRRGFSRSGPRRTRRLRDHVVDAAALLAGLNAQPATIVGWSMGGVIALGLAIQHPGAVASVVVIEPPLHSMLVATTSSSRALAAWTWRVARRDYTVLMALLMLSASAVVAFNVAADVAHALIDSRVTVS